MSPEGHMLEKVFWARTRWISEREVSGESLGSEIYWRFGKYEGTVREEERAASRHSGFNLALKRRTSGRGGAMSERGAGCHWLGRTVVAMDVVHCALSIGRKATRLGPGESCAQGVG